MWPAYTQMKSGCNTETSKTIINYFNPEQGQIELKICTLIEFLNSQLPPGLPPHDLRLKVGVPVMSLRNVEPPELCNGRHLIIKRIRALILMTTILSGLSAGMTKLLTPMSLSHSAVPFEFMQWQFPVKVCFAMSINKAQGQSLQVVGLNLIQQVFTHGQLYVRCSCVGSPHNIFNCGNPGNTRNVVYKEALQ
uniref:DNA helicase Pif1-like 2B domain-containing protein n=1 Tax=Octopus bimaculoides TaxID=37653 RepID=A0A0L8G7U1_OCTBM